MVASVEEVLILPRRLVIDEPDFNKRLISELMESGGEFLPRGNPRALDSKDSHFQISNLMEDAVRFPLVLLSAALLITSACNRNEPRSTQAAPEERTNANANDQWKVERDAYVKDVEARLAEYDQKIDGLEQRAGSMTGTMKTNMKNAIDRLRDQRKDVDAKLDDLKKVNAESWTTMKGQVDSAMANLERSYKEVSQMYEKTPGTPTTRNPEKR